MSTLIKVISFYDVCTSESASKGEFANYGCELREFNFFGYNCLKDAVDCFIDKYKKYYWDCSGVEVGEMLYVADPDIEYSTGVRYYNRLCIYLTESDPNERTELERRIIRALNYLIKKRI